MPILAFSGTSGSARTARMGIIPARSTTFRIRLAISHLASQVGGHLRQGQPRYHFWLAPPLQVHSWTRVPFAVAWPLASRHSRDWTPTMVPSLDSIHSWLAPPVQSQISTAVPAPVPWPRACRHLLPYTR